MEGAYFYGQGTFLRRRCIFTKEVVFQRRRLISTDEDNLKQSAYYLNKKDEPMDGANQFLCRDSVVLKCEAAALMGHSKKVNTNVDGPLL